MFALRHPIIFCGVGSTALSLPPQAPFGFRANDVAVSIGCNLVFASVWQDFEFAKAFCIRNLIHVLSVACLILVGAGLCGPRADHVWAL